MSPFASYADKTSAALTKAEADFKRISGERDAQKLSKPDGSDLDALIRWRRNFADLEMRAEAAEEALEFARAAAAQQAEAAAKAEHDRRHAAAGKLRTAHAKLVLEIAADAEKLAEKLARAELMRANTDAANADRQGRAFIVDGEAKVRQIPERIIPPSFRDEVTWEDANGNRPRTYRRDEKSGELVPNEAGFTRKVIKVCQSQERVEPARMPERLADAMRLVGLKGEQLWPRP